MTTLDPSSFTFDNIPDLSGKVIIVTGGNAGLGYVSARELARKHAHVFLLGRQPDKVNLAVSRIREEIASRDRPAVADSVKIEGGIMDLADLKSVVAFAESFKKRNLPLHVLLNNAGVGMLQFSLTKDGIENLFQTNHLGHFLLTLLLLPIMKKSGPARIVNVSSKAHGFPYPPGILPKEKLNDPASYDSTRAYGQSKLANILFTRELSDRLKTTHPNILVMSLHPGLVQTEIFGKATAFGFLYYVTWILNPFISVTPDKGALTQLYCATAPADSEGKIGGKEVRGQYFEPTAQLVAPSAQATNKNLAIELWDLSESLLKDRGFQVPRLS